MRFAAGVLAVFVVLGCGGPFGRAPLVLTEVPNRASGLALIEVGARRTGCNVQRGREGMRVLCEEGELDVPVFSGPPTFAVRCVDPRLQDAVRCARLVRKVLLASETVAPPPP